MWTDEVVDAHNIAVTRRRATPCFMVSSAGMSRRLNTKLHYVANLFFRLLVLTCMCSYEVAEEHGTVANLP